MRVETPDGEVIELGVVEAAPTIGIVDYSRRVTDAYGATTVVERGFARRLTTRLSIATDEVDVVQARLAALRATSAIWTADDRFASLSVQGFLKDFSLDLPGAERSLCSLTIEGLAEPPAPADGGGDPAPAGQASTLRLVQPLTVTDARLTASSIPEADHPAWSAETIYAAGARVMLAATHRIYESAADGNKADDPAASSGRWIDVGPTNRWAMFDQALGTATFAAGAIEVTIDTGAADALALLDVAAATVRVVAADLDRTIAVGGGPIVLVDLPGGPVTVTISGAGDVSVGTLLAGRLLALGITEAGVGAGITDYSRKAVDDFGEVTLVERAWAKRMTARALIRTDALDLVAGRIAAVRARPSLWIGQSGVDSLTVYGFFKDFTIEVGETVSKLSLTIEGLSKAAPLADPNAATDALAARLDRVQADVDALASDGVITAGREKGRLVQDYVMLANALAAISARDTALGQPADLTEAREGAVAARGALDALLQSYAPAWNDITADTAVDRDVLRGAWIAADQAIAVYAAAITGRKGDQGDPGPEGPTGGSAFALTNVVNAEVTSPNSVRKAAGYPSQSGKARTIDRGAAVSVSGLLTQGSSIGLFSRIDGEEGARWLDYGVFWDFGEIRVLDANHFPVLLDQRLSNAAPLRVVVSTDGVDVTYAIEGYSAGDSAKWDDLRTLPVREVGASVYAGFILGEEAATVTDIVFSIDGRRGSAGRDAVVFHQDAEPVDPVEGDTWVTTTTRIFRQFTGGTWVQLLGDVAALSQIGSAHIADTAVGTSKIADQAVSATTFTRVEAPLIVDTGAGMGAWTTIVSHQVGAAGGETVLLAPTMAYSFAGLDAGDAVGVRLVRGGQVIWGPTPLPAAAGIFGITTPDEVDAGQHLFSLQFLHGSAGASGRIEGRQLTATKLKR